MSLLLLGCTGPRSILDPAGRDAAAISELTWGLFIGLGLIWLVFVGMMCWAVVAETPLPRRAREGMVIGCGAIAPTIVLALILAFSLLRMPPILALGTDEHRIVVTGEQFWWRVQLDGPDGQRVELANELVLPVDERTTITLEAADVIHAFWVPRLAGKIDMIPGRTNHIALEPTQTGDFEGVCAELCGHAHARMLFDVRVVERPAYDAWIAHQAAPAAQPVTPTERRGAELFTQYGCPACHTVRGTDADGSIGPDLTHVGGRLRTAGVTSNDPQGFAAWLRDPARFKPHVAMPAFDPLDPDELEALATWLEALQ